MTEASEEFGSVCIFEGPAVCRQAPGGPGKVGDVSYQCKLSY